MLPCSVCGKTAPAAYMKGGICTSCFMDHDDLDKLVAIDQAKLAEIILTTETAPNLPIAERIDIITAECVAGINVFADIGSAIRDVVGGRGGAVQKALREARKTVLSELRAEAHQIGADAVVAVSLNYSEVSGGGKSMVFVVASGTAVTLAPE